MCWVGVLQPMSVEFLYASQSLRDLNPSKMKRVVTRLPLLNIEPQAWNSRCPSRQCDPQGSKAVQSGGLRSTVENGPGVFSVVEA